MAYSTTSNNFLWIPESYADGGKVTASDELSGYPAFNMIHPHIRRVYKSAVSTSRTLTFILNQYQAWSIPESNCCVLLNHTLQTTDVVTLRYPVVGFPPWVDIPWTVQTNSDGSVCDCQILFFSLFSSSTWYLIITSTTARSIQIGRFILGQYVQLSPNIRNGFTVSEMDSSVGDSKDGKQGFWTTKSYFRTMSIDYDQVGESQADTLLAIYKKNGLSNPFVVISDPRDAPRDTAMYVQFTSPLSLSRKVNRDYEVGTINLEEKV